ncbi:hypothetical protein EUTSA_v10017837mg [Eutrema salsugineum]|uniref:DUF629 domain-containing protein n=1 Tax=Eutrema salsugineum TaxID=72664 RepID=V4MHK4_EUTSA|nr:uncharacterized protein LOC18026996 [Eutrema salsugineum]ESQ52018.1 hypothetical protein EUTSA_v10017837mg [Eutrema salsugineum]
MNSESGEETKKKIRDAYRLARGFLKDSDHNHIKALATTQKTISAHGTNPFCSVHHLVQGEIFSLLASKTDAPDVKCLFLFASLDSYSSSSRLYPQDVRSFSGYATSLIELGDKLGINNFYAKALSKANNGLTMLQSQRTSQSLEYIKGLEKNLQDIINRATRKMATRLPAVTFSDRSMASQMVLLNEQEKRYANPSADEFKMFWINLDDKAKKNFMVVDATKLIEYIHEKYDNKVKENFQKCLCVLDDFRWRVWKCHLCPQVNYCFTDCMRHVFDNHVNRFVPQVSARPKCVSKSLSDMICFGDWEPVDIAAAANLIKSSKRRGEEFVYVNGWYHWPVAKDEERKHILKQFAEVLKSSCPNENNTLSCTLWNWIIDYTEEKLKIPSVPGAYLDKCGFFKNPQCICFLDVKELKYIFDYTTQLTTDVRIKLVSTAVNRFWKKSLFKERIDFERGTNNLLLDERLLYEGEHHFDDVGTVRTFKSSGIYDHVIPKGDNFVSWVLDCPKIDADIVSQVADRVQNLDIWLAALRIVRCTVGEVGSNYDLKQKMLTYHEMLDVAEAICAKEDKRKNVNLRSRYAWQLQMECEEYIKHDKHFFLNVVRDVLEGTESPRFEEIEDTKLMEFISRHSTTVQNDFVKESLLNLRNSLTKKLHLIDSKILLSEFMLKELHEFPKLSIIDNRLVVFPFVKMFLQDKLRREMMSIAAGDSDERDPKKGRRF